MAIGVGVYGGTFDPIHTGHLAAAEAVRDTFGLSTILFVPNWQQPLKSDAPRADAASRWSMLQAAILGNEYFAASPIELDRREPSYSVDTLDQLHRTMPNTQLRFILGVDAANQLPEWRLPERILVDYRPIVMKRSGFGTIDWQSIEGIRPDARALVDIAKVPALDISSTAIRAGVAAGKSIRYLVPDAVRAIIEDRRLYRLDE
jgi:nicotinate-nucleotide adenylyltransferase